MSAYDDLNRWLCQPSSEDRSVTLRRYSQKSFVVKLVVHEFPGKEREVGQGLAQSIGLAVRKALSWAKDKS